MFKKQLLGCVFAGLMAVTASQAEVVVKLRPPKVRVEQRGRAPGRDYVWVNGYNRWDNNAYNWVPGKWEAPPRPRAHWVPGKWQHRRDGYVYIEGRWR